MTLLAEALKAPAVKREPDRETLDLAIAYYHGRVTDRQAGAALKCSPSNAAAILSRSLRWAVQAGTIKPLEYTK
jgi:hypothetical protein